MNEEKKPDYIKYTLIGIVILLAIGVFLKFAPIKESNEVVLTKPTDFVCMNGTIVGNHLDCGEDNYEHYCGDYICSDLGEDSETCPIDCGGVE